MPVPSTIKPSITCNLLEQRNQCSVQFLFAFLSQTSEFTSDEEGTAKKNESLLREHQPSGITVPNRFPFTSWFVCSPAISPIVSIHWAAAVDFTIAGARNRSRSLSAEKKRFLIPRTQSRDVRKWCEAIKIPPMQASLPFGTFMANEQRPDTLRPTKRKEYLNFEGGSDTRKRAIAGASTRLSVEEERKQQRTSSSALPNKFMTTCRGWCGNDGSCFVGVGIISGSLWCKPVRY